MGDQKKEAIRRGMKTTRIREDVLWVTTLVQGRSTSNNWE